MILQSHINELYNTLSDDLSIKRFKDESDYLFRCRLVYSALAKWILALFSDRDFESEDNEQISKSHVTISAMSILKSYKKVDSKLAEFFINDKDFVNLIEDTYVRIGYVKSGIYSFKRQEKNARIRVSNKCLVIDSEVRKIKVRGLGLWGKLTNFDTSLDDYLLINEKAENYAFKTIEQLKYSIFDSELGKIEIYNIEKNRWDPYSSKLASIYSYSIVKIDNGLDYKIIKKVKDNLYGASLPTVYTKKSNDFYFGHEVWRIILGICSLNGFKAKCYLKKKEDSIQLKLNGFVLPYLEDAILRCMCWPMKNSLNVSEFITDITMKDSVVELLSKFSIDIVEVN